MTRSSPSLAATLGVCAAFAALLPGAAVAQYPAARAAPQDPAVVMQVAEDFLRQQLAALPGEPVIRIDEARTERLPACDALSAFISNGARPRARMSVGVRCAAPQPWSTYVQATVSVPGQYYVAARVINAGERITRENIAPQDGDLVALPPGAVSDAEAVLGMTASYRIGSGQPVKQASLRSAGSIQRGQTVRVTARGAGFAVSSDGQAMENAAPGSMVQVRMASGQIVSGVVQPRGTVEVPL